MADPYSWAMVGMYAATTMVAAKSASNQQRVAGWTNELNSTLNKQHAQSILQSTNINEDRQRRQANMQLGNMRAGISQNNLDLTSGTGNDVYKQSSEEAEMDALNLRYTGLLKANNSSNAAALDDYSAQVRRRNASSAMAQGYISSGAAAFAGGAKAYGTQNLSGVF